MKSKQPKAKQGMKPEEIKANLVLLGIKVLDIAEEADCRPNTVSQVMHKKRTSARIQQIIAEKIGRDPKQVFPNFRGERAA